MAREIQRQATEVALPVLHGPTYSTYTRTARLAFHEKGIEYRLADVDIFGGDAAKAPFLALSPFGKVPVLEHRGAAIYETAAIARYIDEAFSGPALQPTDPLLRARMGQIVGLIDAYAYRTLVGEIVMQRVVLPVLGRRTNPQIVRKAVPAMRQSLHALEALAADDEFLCGPALSLADLHLAPIVHYFSGTPEGKRILPTLPKLVRWWPAMRERDSMRRTLPTLT
jgi:glutathione S-transferase